MRLSAAESPTHSRDVDLIVGTLAGRYEVLECVAKGGFGVVYRGRHLELDAPVAIKLLTAADRYAGEARDEYLAMFRREARTLAALDHPALVRVLDYGSVSCNGRDLPWMALEWLDGITLESDLRARDGVGRSPRDVLELLRPAFDALACAHDTGVSHRDIKPSNLMLVTAKRGAPAIKVIDFGVAKVDDPSPDPASGATRTDAALVAFSTRYAAPEQLTRTRTGPWTDVHALALVITELLTGRHAYSDDTRDDLIEAVLREARPTPSRHGLDVGPWETVLARALSRTPSSRQQNASALWSELSSSVEEAQAAWAASPAAQLEPRSNPNGDTLDQTAAPSPSVAPSPRVEALRTPSPERPHEATSVMLASVLPSPRRPSIALLAALAIVALAIVAVVASSRRDAQGARPSSPAPTFASTPAPAPSNVAPAASPTAQPAPAPIAPEIAPPRPAQSPPRVVTPRAFARRPARSNASADAGSSPPHAEPRLVLE